MDLTPGTTVTVTDPTSRTGDQTTATVTAVHDNGAFPATVNLTLADGAPRWTYADRVTC